MRLRYGVMEWKPKDGYRLIAKCLIHAPKAPNMHHVYCLYIHVPCFGSTHTAKSKRHITRRNTKPTNGGETQWNWSGANGWATLNLLCIMLNYIYVEKCYCVMELCCVNMEQCSQSKFEFNDVVDSDCTDEFSMNFFMTLISWLNNLGSRWRPHWIRYM